MTWSISISAPSKTEAKRAATRALGAQMLSGSQAPHARDFNAVQAAVHGAIDACAEGSITVSANGYLSGDWIDGDIPNVTGVSMSVNAYSAQPSAA